jgi:low temperature requirement protein LtrA
MTTVPLARTGQRRSEVGPVELFFDLVYVFAIIQLSHLLIEHLSWEGEPSRVLCRFYAGRISRVRDS